MNAVGWATANGESVLASEQFADGERIRPCEPAGARIVPVQLQEPVLVADAVNSGSAIDNNDIERTIAVRATLPRPVPRPSPEFAANDSV